jgi:hypothetical protein
MQRMRGGVSFTDEPFSSTVAKGESGFAAG